MSSTRALCHAGEGFPTRDVYGRILRSSLYFQTVVQTSKSAGLVYGFTKKKLLHYTVQLGICFRGRRHFFMFGLEGAQCC